MIRSLASLLLAVSIFCLTSCTKPSDSNDNDCQVQTINYGTAPAEAYKITMDNGHLVQLTRVSDPQDKKVFQYNSLNQLVKREDFHNYDNLGADLVRARWEHFYDASGKMVKTVVNYQSYTGGMALGLYEAYIDSMFYTNDVLTEIRTYSLFNGSYIYQGREVWAWNNGDIMSIVQYNQNGSVGHSFSFTYDTKESELNKMFPGFYIQERAEYGIYEGLRRSKHVLISATEKYTPYSNPIPTTYVYTYTPKGKLKTVQSTQSGYTTYSYQFGYSCD